MDQIPIVSLIATCGRSLLLSRALPSLEKCVLPQNYKGVIIAYNGSDPTWGKDLPSYSIPINVIHSTQTSNKSIALNTALDSLQENHLIYFHDDDMKIAPNALIAMSEAGAANGYQGYFGGPVQADFEEAPDPDLLPHFGRGIRGYLLEFTKCTELSHPEFLGGNWAALSDDLKRYRFDERLGPGLLMGGEESRIQRKLSLIRPGYYVPGARAFHYVAKNRCNLRWAFSRKYRAGIHYGFFSEEKSTARDEFLKILYYSGVMGYAYVMGDRHKRLGALLSCVYSTGYLRGWIRNKLHRNHSV